MSHAAQTNARLTKLTEEYRNVMDNYQISIQSLSDACQESLQSTLAYSPHSTNLNNLIKSQCILKLSLEKESLVINSLRVNQSTNLVKDFTLGLKGYEKMLMGKEGDRLVENVEEYKLHKHQCLKIVPDLDGDEVEEDEDADLIMGEQVISLICPITQATMDTAWKSTKCGHVYSSAIKQLCARGQVECPVAGCRHYVQIGVLVVDKAIQKRIKMHNLTLNMRDDHDDYEMV